MDAPLFALRSLRELRVPDDRLLTVMQISDLHFSDRLPGSGVDPAVPPLLAHFSALDGLLGHHQAALNQLAKFYHALGEDAVIAVTGDITANGAPVQRTLAHDYISRPIQTTAPGLDHPVWKRLGIYGNHDHWAGTNHPLGGPTPGFMTFFPSSFPAIRDFGPLNKKGVFVRFILLDTDADVSSVSFNRFLARGSFVSQLATIQNDLDGRGRDHDCEIRVLLMHHSTMPSKPTAAPGTKSFLGTLEIDQQTLRVLRPFLVDYAIKVILCGHRHTPRITPFYATNGVQLSQVFEARCGTTTQLDRYPPAVLAQIGNPGQRMLPFNSLVVHRVLERPDGIFWRSEVFLRSKLHGGFVHYSRLNDPRLGVLQEEFKVLPP